MREPGYHTAVTLTLSNDSGVQPQFEVKSVLSETWANRVCVREGAVYRVIRCRTLRYLVRHLALLLREEDRTVLCHPVMHHSQG